MKKLFFAIGMLAITVCYGQHNKYLFVEPNVSISYDSTLFKKGQIFINSVTETEEFDFAHKKLQQYKVQLHIKAGTLKRKMSLATQDSLMLLSEEKLEEFRKMTNQQGITIIKMPNKVDHINGFSCMSSILYHPRSKHNTNLIKGLIAFEGGYCEVTLTSQGEKGIDTDFKVMETFLSGINYYTPQQINEQDSILKKSYTVLVDSIPPMQNHWGILQSRALIHTKEKLLHTIWTVVTPPELQTYQNLEEPYTGKEVIIKYNREELLGKECYLIIYNSFGKKVKLPFFIP